MSFSTSNLQQSASASATLDGNLDASQGQIAKWDGLSADARSWAIDKSAALIDDVDDGDELASLSTEVDLGDTADLDKIVSLDLKTE